MKKKSSLIQFSSLLLLNACISAILSLVAYFYTIPAFALAVPVFFLLFASLQQTLTTPQHSLFIAMLIFLIPLLNFLATLERTIICSAFFIFTLASFDSAIRIKRPLPIPDFIPFIFILVAQMVDIDHQIIFGLVLAYYLSRLTALYLMTTRHLILDEEKKND